MPFIGSFTLKRGLLKQVVFHKYPGRIMTQNPTTTVVFFRMAEEMHDMRYAFEKHILRWILAHYLPCNIDYRVSSKCFFDRSYRTFRSFQMQSYVVMS